MTDAGHAGGRKRPPGFLAAVFGSPAVVLTLLIPGLGHLYLGRARRGLLWFAVVEGLFLAGWALLGMRLFGGGFNLGQTVFGLPLLYLPEVGNFLTTFLAVKSFPAAGSAAWGDAVALAKLPRPGESLGFLLTAYSGLLNAFAAADAWWQGRAAPARPLRLSPPVAALHSWLVPGLAQWRLGARATGILQFAAVTGLFLLGLAFSGFTAVDRGQVYFWYAGMTLNGGATALASLLFSWRELDNTGTTLWDLGVTTCTIAGLMNVVVILDAYTMAEKAGGEAP